MKTLPKTPDVAVIGAGSVGCATALAFAHQGASVLLLEANPDRAKRFAGEWLHPPGVEILKHLQVELGAIASAYPQGEGFVVFPDDRSEPIRLNYPDGAKGVSCEHNLLVSTIREAATAHPNVYYLPFAKVNKIVDRELSFSQPDRGTISVMAEQIVGADGRTSIVRQQMGVTNDSRSLSYMAGVMLEGVELPFEGFGHIFLGGPGPVLAYRIGIDRIRLCLDVPISHFRDSRNKTAYLWEMYRSVLPEKLLPAFQQALEHKQLGWCANQFCPRLYYGQAEQALVGDATGYCHPITATGMTLGFKDAIALVTSKNFDRFRQDRLMNTYVPELLAHALYQVFTRQDETAIAIRQAIYQMWRQDPNECQRTMQLLATMETKLLPFSRSFLKGLKIAIAQLIQKKATQRQWRQIFQAIGSFKEWLYIPIAIGLPRLGCSIRVKRIPIPDD
ncbi:MAG: FAD-dependent oxidoreductase [Cyanosarcina radialis HA8281-LM2]|nr:FAD-dependent oxidoreductase [Cyanosarcina radialis HA8281-LM2]